MLAPDQLPFNLDAWDGYAACRDRVFSSFAEHGTNPVVLAGIRTTPGRLILRTNGQAVGVEVGTPAVNSPGLETYLPTDPAELGPRQCKMPAQNCLPWIQPSAVGLRVTLTPEAMTNQWHFVSTVLDRDFTVERGSAVL